MKSAEEKIVAENEKAIFFTNMMTGDLSDGFRIIGARQKESGYREYILLDGGEPVYSSQKIEDIWVRKDVLARLKMENGGKLI